MALEERKNKYIVYDASGRVILITSNKRIAEHYDNHA
jgi:hypothetical protein